MQPIYMSLAALGTVSVMDAVHTAKRSSLTLLDQPIATTKLQICPQNRRGVWPALCQQLVELYPDTEFRLHANVNVLGSPKIVDATGWGDYDEWWHALRRASKALNAKAYTLHAGRRANSTLTQLFDNVRAIQDFLGIPVGIEGMYPDPHNTWLVNTWAEYEVMWHCGVNYAIDLSHLNIVANRESKYPYDLLQQLLSSPQCIEVHISDNTGDADSHRHITAQPWWWDSLAYVNPKADIFTEGYLVPHLIKQQEFSK